MFGSYTLARSGTAVGSRRPNGYNPSVQPTAAHARDMSRHAGYSAILRMRTPKTGKPLHGHKSHLNILMPDNPLMYGMAQGTTIGRYHSWVVEPAGISPEIAVTATDEQGNIMAISHRKLPLFGVQFHPESVISACGPRIISNFLNLCNKNGRP